MEPCPSRHSSECLWFPWVLQYEALGLCLVALTTDVLFSNRGGFSGQDMEYTTVYHAASVSFSYYCPNGDYEYFYVHHWS